MAAVPGLEVRPMTIDEVDVRIDYFHAATDEQLAAMGVERHRLPDQAAWKVSYEADAALPIEERQHCNVAWLLDDEIIGFSSAHPIEFGVEAFLHLHVLDVDRRRSGIGAEAVRRTAAIYFDLLGLQRIYSEPYALNVAPNRTLQAAGFRYLYSHHTTPGPLNHPQIVTRWVLERPGA